MKDTCQVIISMKEYKRLKKLLKMEERKNVELEEELQRKDEIISELVEARDTGESTLKKLKETLDREKKLHKTYYDQAEEMKESLHRRIMVLDKKVDDLTVENNIFRTVASIQGGWRTL